MDKKLQRRQALPILTVLLLAYIGYSMVIPIFPPLLFNPEHGMLPAQHTEATRNIIMGLLIAMYPLGQFFGCPMLGKISDKYGRKKVLLFSLAWIVPCYILSGLAIMYTHISLLFFSRFLCGLFEGNTVIATAAMADISEDHKDKVKNFGWITSVSSSGFIIGPLIGGKLADPNLVSWFNYSTPFWMTAILVTLTWFFVYFRFLETRPYQPDKKLEFNNVIKTLYKSFKIEQLKPIFVGNFSLYLSFFFFFAFLPVLLVRQFGFNSSSLAEVEAYLSIPICLSPLMYRYISRKFSPSQAAAMGGFIFAGSIVLILGFDTPKALIFTLLPPGIGIAIGFTYTTLMISDRVSPDIQGEALGTNQSVLVFAEMFSGLLGGVLAAIWMKLPLVGSVVFALFSAIWLIFRVRKTPYEKVD